MVDRMIQFILFMLLSMGGMHLAFAEMIDPTRPPAGIVSSSSGGSSAQPPVVQVAPRPTGLQSVIISKQYRAAIIGGEVVKLGEEYKGSRLIEVSEGRVVLLGKQGRRVMKMFPGVNVTNKKKATNNISKAVVKSRTSGVTKVGTVVPKGEK